MVEQGISNFSPSASSVTSSYSPGRHHVPSMRKHVDHKIAEKERRAVFFSKVAVIVALLLAVVFMSTAAYQVIVKSEEDKFRTQFATYASEVDVVSHENAANVFAAVDAFAVSISSFAKASKQRWPFVTVPDFEARASRVRSLAGADNLVYITIVEDEQWLAWEEYSRKYVSLHQQESLDYMGVNMSAEALNFQPAISNATYTGIGHMHYIFRDGKPGPYFVHWQVSPLPIDDIWTNYSLPIDDIWTNYNFANAIENAFPLMNATKLPTLNYIDVYGLSTSQLIQPIYDKVTNGNIEERKIVAVLWMSLDWGNYLRRILPDDATGIYVVLDTGCGDSLTYQINGLEANLIGSGYLHDPKYDCLKVKFDFVKFGFDESKIPEGLCVPQVTMYVYPSDELKEKYMTSQASLVTIGVIVIFLFTSLVFSLYDFSVRQHQTIVMRRLIQQDKIVSNLFPYNIRNRLYGDIEESGNEAKDGVWGLDSGELHGSAPLADLFPSATVFFADISGFTAWSSTREPPQVFLLLESIYNDFDRLANIHGVFKVETIGDCYVAVAGLPDPNPDHAVAAAKFARCCLRKMTEKTRQLELTLGPDTGDLELRIGIHSGQVTAGVLRGERSRFQLFGDTVNTAARMESTCIKSKIQVSSATAEILQKNGKSRWLTPRGETVSVKGKGEMETFWLLTKAELSKIPKPAASGKEQPDMTSITEMDETDESEKDDIDSWGEEDEVLEKIPTKAERLIEWNVDVLSKLLQQILAARQASQTQSLAYLEQRLGHGSTVLEEFKETITLPKISPNDIEKRKDPATIKLDEEVISQIRDYVRNVAYSYRENAFHNFEHASHVTASVRKLLTRIVSCDRPSRALNRNDGEALMDLAGHSYGITSDPLTQFAVVFSAIIHDMDHPGVTNDQLVKEKIYMASKYKEKSVAEQNSVDLAWEMLMRPRYKNLRACIYSSKDELKRFRQLVVNTVMATDICDKELQALRKARWEMAFSETQRGAAAENVDRKATIVIEHLIQASDVSHTMQHWQIYKKWNEKFFFEKYGAYKNGHMDADPSPGWYKDEIAFFDFYVIPLAKKLESCGVFGVSSHEYLSYAMANREEWAMKGEDIVEDYLANYRALQGE